MPKLPPHSCQMTLFLSLLLLSALPLLVNSQSDEQTILLSLKKEWNNPPLISSWDPKNQSNHCNWTFITCNEHGSVTDLNLTNINITNKIPPSICLLKNLTLLFLNYNYIPGDFPTLLYSCSNLQYLDLSQNSFVGPIPSDIDRMSSLLYLDLGANNFSGAIPKSIGNLPVLQVLNIYQNPLTSFPVEIGNLSNLVQLRLAYNQFVPSIIPAEFGRLKKLNFLWMAGSNLIGEIPDIFGDLPALELLDLKTNNLTGKLPRSLFLSKSLKYLYLPENRLSGEIPTPIQSLNLTDIDLSINELTGSVPEDFGKLHNLKNLSMYKNRLTGELPANIGKLPNLTEIRLFMNNFSGVLPPELGLHSKLETLEVCQNQLTGELPENLCANGVFIGVVAFSNNLSGGLPSSFEKCDSLRVVQLYKNNFAGRVPYSFWSLKNLEMVIINDNLFLGDLPDTLSWNLSRLEMNNNRFSGKIPSKINSSIKLQVLEASNNLFSGEIPLGLTALSELGRLLLDGNQLSGQIPMNIISWKSLTILNLSGNHLSGVIPSTLGSLPDLLALDLSRNQILGPIPIEISKLKLTTLDLSSNKLTGKVPNGFDNPVFDSSFLNNTGLCTDDPAVNVRPCFFSNEPPRSRKLSSGFLAMILILSGGILLFFVLFTLFVIKDYQKRKLRSELSSWKLTSFQRLDFTESNIVSNLTENNLIGSGGSGKVYHVVMNHSGNHVAVKKIWSKANLDQNLEKEFLAEVQILGTIRHLNIVKLLCCITNDKSKFLVYEYMKNRSLDRWLQRKKGGTLASNSVSHSLLDWPRRMRIAIGGAQGLCYMHHNCSPPIIHRDVKSSNILLDSEFNAKIADFGLARMLHKHGENTMSVVAGSFGYIAPEYAHTTRVNEKIDVYSFGVVLLELVTGKEANHGDEHTCLAEKSWRHFQDGNFIEAALDEEVKEPGYLEEMCMVFKLGLMCTSTLPSDRPSMKEVLQILVWRGPLQAYGEKKARNENAVAPLLDATTEYEASYKSNQWKRNSDEDDFSCNV